MKVRVKYLENRKDRLEPVPINQLSKFKVLHLATGAMHCVAVLDMGNCYSWGKNSHGQLGIGTKQTEIFKPTPIKQLSQDN